MNSKFVLAALLAVIVFVSFAPMKPVGQFQKNADIGNPKLAGSSIYDARTKEYTLTGSGYNIWFERDEFQFLYRQLKGDFTVTADFEFVGATGDGHRKVGWMVRESLDDNASHLSAVSHGDGLTVLQWRIEKGKAMRDPEDEIFSTEKNVQTVQVERKGKNYTMRVGKKGSDLQTVGSHEMPNLPDQVLVGLFICSHNPAKVEEAKVRNVRIVGGK
jgi:regulation of enolase protein 1 (concanavalin A-like superfamily)